MSAKIHASKKLVNELASILAAADALDMEMINDGGLTGADAVSLIGNRIIEAVGLDAGEFWGRVSEHAEKI